MSPSGFARAAVVAIGILTSPACAIHGINFAQDNRVRIVQPRDFSTQRLPVVLRWEKVGPHRHSAFLFALFVDRAPMAPGKDLGSLAEHDMVCRTTPGCPDQGWFNTHGVYLTSGNSYELDELADFGSRHAKDTHEATIVLLDSGGRRHSESAFSVTFSINRSRS
jgi:hypothetical protein